MIMYSPICQQCILWSVLSTSLIDSFQNLIWTVITSFWSFRWQKTVPNQLTPSMLSNDLRIFSHFPIKYFLFVSYFCVRIFSFEGQNTIIARAVLILAGEIASTPDLLDNLAKNTNCFANFVHYLRKKKILFIILLLRGQYLKLFEQKKIFWIVSWVPVW